MRERDDPDRVVDPIGLSSREGKRLVYFEMPPTDGNY